MHILVRFLIASFLANAGLGQPCFAELTDNIRISKLVIESSSLPGADRERIIRLFQQRTYFQPEIGDHIRSALRDLGYFKAVVDQPRFSFPTQVEGRRVTNVTVKVEPGVSTALVKFTSRRRPFFLRPDYETSSHCEGENSSTQPRLARVWRI